MSHYISISSRNFSQSCIQYTALQHPFHISTYKTPINVFHIHSTSKSLSSFPDSQITAFQLLSTFLTTTNHICDSHHPPIHLRSQRWQLSFQLTAHNSALNNQVNYTSSIHSHYPKLSRYQHLNSTPFTATHSIISTWQNRHETKNYSLHFQPHNNYPGQFLVRNV